MCQNIDISSVSRSENLLRMTRTCWWNSSIGTDQMDRFDNYYLQKFIDDELDDTFDLLIHDIPRRLNHLTDLRILDAKMRISPLASIVIASQSLLLHDDVDYSELYSSLPDHRHLVDRFIESIDDRDATTFKELLNDIMNILSDHQPLDFSDPRSIMDVVIKGYIDSRIEPGIIYSEIPQGDLERFSGIRRMIEERHENLYDGYPATLPWMIEMGYRAYMMLKDRFRYDISLRILMYSLRDDEKSLEDLLRD